MLSFPMPAIVYDNLMDFLVNYCFKQIFYIMTKKKQFLHEDFCSEKGMFVCQKVFDVLNEAI